MSYNISGLTADTFDNLQLNAGAFFKNLAWSTATTATTLKAIADAAVGTSACLGATRGGGTFEVTTDTREVTADGMRSPFVGSTIVDGVTAKLTTTLIEAIPGNFQLAIGCADLDSSSTDKKKIINGRTEYKSDDYISKLQWVGTTQSGYVLIELDNALSTGGLKFTFTDKGEGTIPIEMTATQGSLSDSSAPYRIVVFTD